MQTSDRKISQIFETISQCSHGNTRLLKHSWYRTDQNSKTVPGGSRRKTKLEERKKHHGHGSTSTWHREAVVRGTDWTNNCSAPTLSATRVHLERLYSQYQMLSNIITPHSPVGQELHSPDQNQPDGPSSAVPWCWYNAAAPDHTDESYHHC